MPYQYPGMSNTYIPDHAATGHLVTQFSRNPKDFPLARYIQYRPIKTDRGFYLRLNIEQAGRVSGGTMDEYVWPSGADAPRRNAGTDKFSFEDYYAQRFAPDFTLDDMSMEQAGWDVKGVETANLAQQAMTLRTRRVHTALENASNWDATHRVDVTTLSFIAGRWDQSTTGRLDIKKSINYAVNLIRQDTLAVIKSKEDFRLVMNPRTAQKIGESQEMVGGFMQSPLAMPHWQGEKPTYTEWGIPKYLYGIEVVVEDTVMVTSIRNATTVVRQDVCADGVAYLLARPGGLVAKSGGPSYSTAMCFTLKDMEVEVRHDINNKRLDGRIIDFTAEEVVAPVSGFVFLNVV